MTDPVLSGSRSPSVGERFPWLVILTLAGLAWLGIVLVVMLVAFAVHLGWSLAS